MKRNIYGFTPVELIVVINIVVITILVILGTIAFLSLGGYSTSARDGSRVTDITNLSKALDIAYVKTSSYPMPDSSFTVTYSRGAVWYQGDIGNSVTNILSTAGAKLSKNLTDPLATTKPYIYSKLAYGYAYQLKADWEGESVAYNSPSPFGRGLGGGLITQSQAASGNPTLAYIVDNYNGVIARTETGSMTFILAVPSIISNTGSTGTPLSIDTGNTLSGALLMHGGSNTAGIIYNPNKIVYQSGSLPSNSTQTAMVSSGIVAAYSGTTLAIIAQIQPFILAQASSDDTALANLGGSVINSIGGKLSTTVVPPPPFACGTSVTAGGYTYTTKVGLDGKCWTKENMKHTPSAGNRWTYGSEKVYDWVAANSNLCSQLGAGWALPTYAQWTALTTAGATGWTGNKLSGIVSSLPGYRHFDNSFNSQGAQGLGWSSLQSDGSNAYTCFLMSGDATTDIYNFNKTYGLSVVCLKN